MNYEDPTQVSLAGRLILADPSLREPCFRRSVLLLTNHSAEGGAHGYILNRPLGKNVGDLLSDDEFSNLSGVPVFVGGPVSSEQMTFSSIRWNPADKAFDYEVHLSAKDATQRLLEGFIVRAFVGYAGWSEGQLESELKQRAWITHKPEAFVLEADRVASLWADLLRKMSPWHRLLADSPEEPGLN